MSLAYLCLYHAPTIPGQTLGLGWDTHRDHEWVNLDVLVLLHPAIGPSLDILTEHMTRCAASCVHLTVCGIRVIFCGFATAADPVGEGGDREDSRGPGGDRGRPGETGRDWSGLGWAGLPLGRSGSGFWVSWNAPGSLLGAPGLLWRVFLGAAKLFRDAF